jgi:tyrosinase
MSQTTYDNFWNSLDGIPFKPTSALHDAGHGFMGGDMVSFYTSPNGQSALSQLAREFLLIASNPC